MRTLEICYAPAVRGYRVDGDDGAHTYDTPDEVVSHLRRCHATALLSPPPHTEKTAQLAQALAVAGLAIVYGVH